MELYPSYQLPPQVRALAGRGVGGPGGVPNDSYLQHPKQIMQSAFDRVAVQPETVYPQDAAPDMSQDQRAFIAGAQQGMGGGAPVNPQLAADAANGWMNRGPLGMPQQGGVAQPPSELPAAPQDVQGQLPPQVRALAEQTPGTMQPPAQPIQQRPDYSNMAGGLARGAYNPYMRR